MQSWKAFTSAANQAVSDAGQALASVDSSKLKTTFQGLAQTVKERAGTTTSEDVTELPQGETLPPDWRERREALVWG